ncbi:MAG: polyamine aminopropyltransferase, partial [Clostridium sp.]|uniref:spermine/spermidine synthase domain-containing protein n=1 Tax=Clostridium sp. TaxID=1506 RepID=UPI003F3B0161
EEEENLKETIANILSFDYIGALIGSLAFPLVLLPNLGQLKTSFLVGIINIIVGTVLVFVYKKKLKNYKILRGVGIGLFLIMGTFFLNGDKLSKSLEDNLYRDRVIYSTQTKYQKIVATKHKDDFRLFLNGNIQFSSKDEYRYHEVLVHPAMSLAKDRERILVLGGGDGLAVREILKYEDVKEITLVDIDNEMVEYCKSNKEIKKLNEGSLENDKLKIVTEDAYIFLEENRERYDVVIVDLPDPNNEGLNKLYTNVFYRLIYSSLTKEGVLVVQSTSPLNSNSAFWCINETIKSEDFKVKPMEVYVPSFGSWGFNICKKSEFNVDKLRIEKELKYLNEDTVKEIFFLGEDEKKKDKKLEINTLNKPKLIEYYSEAVDRI